MSAKESNKMKKMSGNKGEGISNVLKQTINKSKSQNFEQLFKPKF